MTSSDSRLDSAPAPLLDDARRRLERALVARFGIDVGADAAADAVLYAVENWERVGRMANPVGYLYRVGVTRAGRSARRRRSLDLLVDHPITTDRPVDVDLQRALGALRPEQRIAIVLVHGHGHSYAEVAEILDVPVTSVTNHVHRGLARVRRRLEES